MDSDDLSGVLLDKGRSPRELMLYWRVSRLMALRHKSFRAHFITQSEYGGETPKTLDTPELYNLDIAPSENGTLRRTTPKSSWKCVALPKYTRGQSHRFKTIWINASPQAEGK